MQDYHIPLQPNEIYHIFTRAIGDEKLFLNPDNYTYFLKKIKQHILPVADLYTYSLLPNHFHLLVRIKETDTIVNHFESKKNKRFDSLKDSLPEFIMERFSNCLNSYTKSFNKVNHRMGALFMNYLSRVEVKQDSDFSNFVFYVHKNAVHHGLTRMVGEWPHDGYRALIGKGTTNLLREELLDWFGGREAFIKFHAQPIEFKKDRYLDI